MCNYIEKNCQIEVCVTVKVNVSGDLTVALREFIRKKLGGVKPMRSARNVRLNLRDILNLENYINVLGNNMEENCQIEVSVMAK